MKLDTIYFWDPISIVVFLKSSKLVCDIIENHEGAAIGLCQFVMN